MSPGPLRAAFIALALGACPTSRAAVTSQTPAPDAACITPDYRETLEPSYTPVSLYWHTISATPFVYRRLIVTPPGCDRAVAIARSSGYLIVWVDGRQVFRYVRAEKDAGPPDPERLHEIDLTSALARPWSHELAVSAPKEGFALGGELYAGTRAVAAFSSHGGWRVAKLPPTTILEDDPVIRLDYSGPDAPVRGGERFSVSLDPLAAASRHAVATRAKELTARSRWRLSLFEDRGIYLRDGQEHFASRTVRMDPQYKQTAHMLARRAAAADIDVHEAETIERELDALFERAWMADDGRMIRLAASVLAPVRHGRSWSRAALEVVAGHPLNYLNESRYDRLGWLPISDLSDGSLSGWGVRVDPDVEVRSTPLSPCVVLTPKQETIRLRGFAPSRVWQPGFPFDRTSYDLRRDGKLQCNALLLWPGPQPSQRPILLVFQANPLAVRADGDDTLITTRPGTRVVAVRPWGGKTPAFQPERLAETVRFWSRAALAVPTDYASVTRVVRAGEAPTRIDIHHLPPDPVLEQTMVYDYLETRDEWRTAPLRLAPLPPLCTLARSSAFAAARHLTIDGAVPTVKEGGLIAPYCAALGADRVRYRYEIEPYPRRGGLTSWMFGGADVGVPGNYREMETIAGTGANSYRPQHNFSDEPSLVEPGRTRVQTMLETCLRVGVNYTNNIDQSLGQPPAIIHQRYPELVRMMLAHYAKLLPQLADTPFWAVTYDLINEPNDHPRDTYNDTIRRLTAAVRERDPVHLLYVEPCESWAGIPTLPLVKPTGDPLTVYSFHDYSFRLNTAADRWPAPGRDLESICRKWLPAFVYQATHGVPLSCGEYGDFRPETYQCEAETVLMNDFLRLFDQFGMHHHYYSGRAAFTIEPDGSLTPSNIVRTLRRYFARPDWNLPYRTWNHARADVAALRDKYARPARTR